MSFDIWVICFVANSVPDVQGKTNVYTLITGRKRRVCLFTGGGGAMYPFSMMHWTSLYRAPWPCNPSPPPVPPQTWDMGTPGPSPFFLLVTSGSHHWRCVETCSLEDYPSTDIWWLPKHVWLTSRWHAFYWNAFLLFPCLVIFAWPSTTVF